MLPTLCVPSESQTCPTLGSPCRMRMLNPLVPVDHGSVSHIIPSELCSLSLVHSVLPREQVSFHAFMHSIYQIYVAFHFTWSITLHRKIQTCIRSISQSEKKINWLEGKFQKDIYYSYPPGRQGLFVEFSSRNRVSLLVFPTEVVVSVPQQGVPTLILQKSQRFLPIDFSPR